MTHTSLIHVLLFLCIDLLTLFPQRNLCSTPPSSSKFIHLCTSLLRDPEPHLFKLHALQKCHWISFGDCTFRSSLHVDDHPWSVDAWPIVCSETIVHIHICDVNERKFNITIREDGMNHRWPMTYLNISLKAWQCMTLHLSFLHCLACNCSKFWILLQMLHPFFAVTWQVSPCCKNCWKKDK